MLGSGEGLQVHLVNVSEDQYRGTHLSRVAPGFLDSRPSLRALPCFWEVEAETSWTPDLTAVTSN